MGMTDTATRLIERFGQSATLTKPVAPAGNPWDPQVGTPTNHAVTLAVTNYTIEQRSNELILLSDLRVFMTAAVEPTTADTLTIGGTEYSIISVGTLSPDGAVICYEVQVRR